MKKEYIFIFVLMFTVSYATHFDFIGACSYSRVFVVIYILLDILINRIRRSIIK